MSGAKKYQINNDGYWLNVGSPCAFGAQENVICIRTDLPIDIATSLAELGCAALNAVEAAKHANNSRVTQGAKRPHARKRTS